MKRKSPEQLQALEDFYSDQKYPTPKEMEVYAESLGLSYKEIRGWFTEKRRRDRKKNGCILPPIKETQAAQGSNRFAETSNKRQDSLLRNRTRTSSSTYSKHKSASSVTESPSRKKQLVLQDLLPPEYILQKVFRKDGPSLGVKFDSLPWRVLRQHKASWLKTSPADKQRATKKRKVSEILIQDPQVITENSAPVKKHGIGKGLMTVWRAVNPIGWDLPPGIDLRDQKITCFSQKPASISRKPWPQKKKQRQLASILKQKRLEKKSREKKRSSIVREQVELNKDEGHKACIEKCELALDGGISIERPGQFAMLVDDEELEMRDLQAGPNPLTCSGHPAVSGLHSCSLCRDLLPKFPPNSVKMKLPFGMQPWHSSPESVKKLFKAFHFLYTYSVTLDVCPFTLDEFVQAFHDKDSLLLGKVHLCLLKLLLLDVKTELQRGVCPNLSISCKFLALLHSVESQLIILDLCKNSLNPLTWTEILRQILVAAGFGSSHAAVRTEALTKEKRLMTKYGLHPGTLKGELFRLLYEQSNNGLKVPDLASHAQFAELNVASSTEELERIISSTLSSDITLFEKISPSTYRLRISCFSEETGEVLSDYEDSGSVDDEPNDTCRCNSDYDSECNSENLSLIKFRDRSGRKHKSKKLKVYTEIDESHPGEPWLLGLTEGEYSDLSIEEKLDVLVALIDLLSAGSTIRMEDPAKFSVECVPRIYSHGSGAKIKRASSDQHIVPRLSWVHGGQLHASKEASSSSVSCPVDSSSVRSFCEMWKSSGSGESAKEKEVEADVHPMQSVYLGSDRRYNRYWLFLGPCNVYDPGHRSVYFESSEDGCWEVIDNEEALRTLLSVLDDRGTREAQLIDSLEKREAFLRQAMSSGQVTRSETSELTDIVREDSSSPLSGIDNNLSLIEVTNDSLSSPQGAIVLEVGKKTEENGQLSRLQEFDAWIWAHFYSNLSTIKHSKTSCLDSLKRCESCHDLYWRDEKHCKICHTTFELDIDLEERYAIHAATCRRKGDNNTFPKHKVLSSRLQSLKAAVHAIESAMPKEALIGAWSKSGHRLWIKRLRRTSSLSELLQVIGDFVGAINEDWLWKSGDDGHSISVMEEIIKCFPAMPQTSSAVALWLVKLDALIAPYVEKGQHERIQENGTRSTSRRACKL